MRATSKAAVGGLTVAGGMVILRPGTRANRVARHQADRLSRWMRHMNGELQGVSYRLRGRQPDPDVSDRVLADRIRSSLGPLEKRLDLPHVHVMVDRHAVTLHGEVADPEDADRIVSAVAAVPGVARVESFLHLGLGPGTTRPSAGRGVHQRSTAMRRLLDAAIQAGADPAVAIPVLRAVLGTFAERVPVEERHQVAGHLPNDLRSMFTPTRRVRVTRPPRTVDELVVGVTDSTAALPHDRAREVTLAVLRELRTMVPEEVADVASVLPGELAAMWRAGTATHTGS